MRTYFRVKSEAVIKIAKEYFKNDLEEIQVTSGDFIYSLDEVVFDRFINRVISYFGNPDNQVFLVNKSGKLISSNNESKTKLERRLRRLEEAIDSNKKSKVNEEYSKLDLEFLYKIDNEFINIIDGIYAFQVLIQNLSYIPKSMRQEIQKANSILKASRKDYETIVDEVEDNINH